MGNVNDRHAQFIPNPSKVEQHPFSERLIEPGQRLVEKQQPRRSDQGPRQRYPLLLTARKPRRKSIQKFAELQSVAEKIEPRAVLPGKKNVIAGAEMRKECSVLWNITKSPLLRRKTDVPRAVQKNAAVDFQPSCSRRAQTSDRFQQRSLSPLRSVR